MSIDIVNLGVHKDWKALLREAQAAGWTVVMQGKYAVATSPTNDAHTFRIANGGSSGYADGRLLRKYRRWITESLLDVVEAAPEGSALAVADAAGYQAFEDGDDLAVEIIGRGLVKKAEAAAQAAVAEPTITREVPWLARKNAAQEGGRLYESEAVRQRTWSDGGIDYACAFDGCDYSAPKPRSVSAHYAAAHVRTGQTEAVTANPPVAALDHDYTEPLTHREYRPSQRLVDALAEWLTTQSWDNTDQLAIAALTWMRARPDLDDVDRPNVGTERTPEQIIEKIRWLVGGRDVEAEDRLHAAEADLSAARLRIEELEADLAQAREANARIHKDLDGLAEIVSSLRGE